MIGFFLNAAFISTGFSALRRTTGINVNKMITSRISHDGLRVATGAYFKMGDVIIDTSMNQFTKIKEANKEDFKKADDALNAEKIRQEMLDKKFKNKN